jgi:hypothetical protein
LSFGPIGVTASAISRGLTRTTAAAKPGLNRSLRVTPGGVLTLAFPKSHPLDDGRDQIILAALGPAAADALSRAIRHDTDRALVMSVQRSLLPKTLPEHPRVFLGACYAPAETRYGIGGDWYDAVLLPGGRILLIVGDVAGHGLNAAITMGQMRSAAHALGPARPAGQRPCSMPWTSSRPARRTCCPRPPPPPLSTLPKEHSGIAWPDIRPCCCAAPTGPSSRSTRQEGRSWARGRRPPERVATYLPGS